MSKIDAQEVIDAFLPFVDSTCQKSIRLISPKFDEYSLMTSVVTKGQWLTAEKTLHKLAAQLKEKTP